MIDCGALASRSDEELLSLYVQEGREDAITVLYLRHRAMLYGYGISRLHDHDSALDLVQITWEEVLKWPRLGEQRDAGWRFKKFLYHVAHNHSALESRRRAVRARAAPELGRLGGLPLAISETCRYCERPTESRGMCNTHHQRKLRGWTEEQMKKPIRADRKKVR